MVLQVIRAGWMLMVQLHKPMFIPVMDLLLNGQNSSFLLQYTGTYGKGFGLGKSLITGMLVWTMAY